MFWLALAAQISVPAPKNVSEWFFVDDVPEYLIRQSGLWLVPVRITVGSDGKIRDCDVEGTSGISDLDKRTCRIIMRRARFKPASIGGAAAPGVYRTTVTWAVADAPFDRSKVSSADIDVTVQRLPAGANSPTQVRVAFVVAPDGTKSSCVVDDVKGFEQIENVPALVSIACDLIMEKYPATPVVDQSGVPITSVQNALVRFSADQ
jgi:TonB family protein